MLLNEMKKQHRTIAEQHRTIDALVARVAELERRPRGMAAAVVTP